MITESINLTPIPDQQVQADSGEGGGVRTKRVRIYLVDDSKEFLKVASAFFAAYLQLEIVGSSTSSVEAIEEIRRLKPDIVMMDVVMPKLNGLEATRRVKKQTVSTKVIIVTLHENPAYRVAAEAVGADGFVPKTEFATEIVSLIDRLCSHDQ